MEGQIFGITVPAHELSHLSEAGGEVESTVSGAGTRGPQGIDDWGHCHSEQHTQKRV